MYGFVRICPVSPVEAAVELTESQSSAVAVRIREELARRRMSRQRLADQAKISISTLEKALNGSRPFTLATIVRLEAALGLALRPQQAASAAATPAELGGYSRTGIAWLEGDYLTLRRSFEVVNAIYAYRTRIGWDEARNCLTFEEADRLDAPFAQKGVVSLPPKSGQIYLYTNEQGQMRLAMLGRPQITGEIYGLLTTLAKGQGSNLTPVSTPLVLLPWLSISGPVLGRVLDTDAAYPGYEKHFEAILRDRHAMVLA